MLLLTASVVTCASISDAQDRCAIVDCVRRAPADRYDAGALHRLLFGSGHRDLWRIPVDIEVLDLSTFAGGLTPLRRGGGGQTISLHFRGADGRRYAFRSVDKDATQGLPSELAMTFVDGVAQDQISALHPYAALVVAPLLDAAGLLHAPPRLVVMPNDPILGTFRADFAGLVGTIEERSEAGPDGTPGFAGATRIVNTEDLFRHLSDSSHALVDARAFLTARLLDVFVGDRDRHPDQWRWALVERAGQRVWLPIPRDRDQAFVGLGGLLVSAARLYHPALVRFDEEYPNIWGATYSGRGLDRRLLSELEGSVWDSVAAWLQTQLTDAVIDSAVRRLPTRVYPVEGERLVKALRRRRDQLRDMARDYYAKLARYVDVHATDAAERADVQRFADGSVEVTIRRADGTGVGSPYFRRRFLPNETSEIRLMMHGGDDCVVVGGAAQRSILVRVVGGGGSDLLTDSSSVRRGKPTVFYVRGGDDRVALGSSARVNRKPRPDSDVWERFQPPPAPDPTVRQPQNWGGFRAPQLWLSAGPDLGLLFGGGIVYYRYGFREEPYRYRIGFRAAYTTRATTGRAELNVLAPALAGRLGGSLLVAGSGIEIVRFYGFGNGTEDEPPAGVSRREFFEVDQQEFLVSPSLSLAVGGNVHLTGGPFFKVVYTERNSGTQLAVSLPEELGRARRHFGATLGLSVDTRDAPRAASRGVLVSVHGTFNTGLLDELQEYGGVRGEVATYLTPNAGPTAPTLALRLAGKKMWGAFPFYDAAFLGGPTTLRGFHRERFAGDASVLGNVEVRVPVGQHRILFPGQVGVFGLADFGRVFFETDTSDKLHTAVGGGASLSFFGRGNTMSLAVVRSSEGVRVYGRGGFLF